MRNKLTVLFLFISVATYCQTGQVKVKKPLTQDKMSTVVTLAGLYYGKSSADIVLADKKLKLSNNTNKIKILNFTVDILSAGTIYSYSCQSDTLSNEVVEKIYSQKDSKSLRLFISPIRATTIGKDTIFLNPIELKLTN